MYNCAVSNPQMSGFHTFKTFAGILADSEEGASVGELNKELILN